MANRLRAFLTALGIIFGVAAVIAMLAIGTGAKQSILEQMKLIGTNNIVVESMIPEEEDNEAENSSKSKDKKKYNKNLYLRFTKIFSHRLSRLLCCEFFSVDTLL